MIIILARPRGFCDGVVRAIATVELELQLHGAPAYVLHEIVHNRHVVENLRQRGALFVESIDEVPPGGLVIFSAHGVPEPLFRQAEQRRLRVVDATCPLVKRVHFRARRYSRAGNEVVIIGHEGHPEVEGTKGWIEGQWHIVSTAPEVERIHVQNPSAVSYVTQTTLNAKHTCKIIGALRRRFPTIVGPELADICHATQSRQAAVKSLTRRIDLLLVVGSESSSNSNRLREVGEQGGCPSYLIEDADRLDPSWLSNLECIGVTAGASAPEVLVQGVVDRIMETAPATVLEMDDTFASTHLAAGAGGRFITDGTPHGM
ncbi:MAG: 4-hydroxy-3-methylbut-2-enyl diphosphate reductase [Desulfobacteraceae bacterium]|nr:MAG: 4-hydroxy-3-methylbut-2-enyl diphosphate reductase [Desulfobacteraceae bacterium]